MKPLLEVKDLFLNNLALQERSPETLKGYNNNLRMFNEFLERKYNCEIYVDDITKQDIEAYMAYLKIERGLTPVSRNRYLASIKSCLTFCFREEWIHRNVGQLVDTAKVVKKERDYLNQDELSILIQHIEQPIVKTAVIFMALTGTRISEAINITFSDLDMRNKLVRVFGKGGKERVLPISEELYEYLTFYLENVRDSDSDRLFATKKTGKLSAQHCRNHINKAAKKCGITKDVNNHILRHTFATSTLQQGTNIKILKQLLGHESLDTTDIYTHTNKEELRFEVNRGRKILA